MRIAGGENLELRSNLIPLATSAKAWPSSRSTPSRSASRVAARYISPVLT